MTLENVQGCSTDAAAAILAGNRLIAQLNIENAIVANRDSIDAWLLYAWTSDSPSAAELAISRAIKIDPTNEVALAGQRWIEGVTALAAELIVHEEPCDDASTDNDSSNLSELTDGPSQVEKTADSARDREEAEVTGEVVAEQAGDMVVESSEDTASESLLVRDVRSSSQESINLPELGAVAKSETESVAALPANPERVDTTLEHPIVVELLEEQIVGQVSDITKDVCEMFGVESTHTGEPSLAETTEVETRQAEAPAPATQTPIADQLTVEGQPVVMIVDDSPTIQKLVSMTLGRSGFSVIAADDGIEAIALLSQQRPDLVLADTEAPRMSGYQLCKQIKKHADTKAIPVLMLADKDGVFDKMRGKMVGANGCISKPFESADLVNQVRQQLLASKTK